MQLTLKVGNAAVRACEVTLKAMIDAGFGKYQVTNSVLALHAKKGSQELVVSFVARDASPLDVVANFAADGQALHLNVASANCYDSSGQVIAEPNLSLK